MPVDAAGQGGGARKGDPKAMEILVWACAGLSVLCGAGAALCQNLGRWLEKFICKTSASVLFCMTAVLALA